MVRLCFRIGRKIMATKDIILAAAGVGGGSSGPLYIDDVFSTNLYTGTGGNQTITNGIDLAGEGGLVWIKDRVNAYDHALYDTERGIYKYLESNNEGAEFYNITHLRAFNSDGFDIGVNAQINSSGANYASWTFRKAEKFFDVVTYTGDGVNGRQLPHNLGSTPGMVICKRIDTGQNWIVQHRSLDLSGNKTMYLNSTAALGVGNNYWNSTHASNTAITLGGHSDINGIGGTYVAYLFAHNAGGFGDDGTENVISCGSYTGNGSTDGPVIDLGFEPQWTIIKRSSATGGNWVMHDNMRGVATGGDDQVMYCNSNSSESGASWIDYTSTGFKLTSSHAGTNASSSTYIYIAIRRGPMKVPTSGTEVYTTDTKNSTNATQPNFYSEWPVDFALQKNLSFTTAFLAVSRLPGEGFLRTNDTDGFSPGTDYATDYSNGWFYDINTTPSTDIRSWMFRRAPGFFDVVCYTGTGSATTVNHNLGVAPEMIIVKARSGPVAPGSQQWCVNHTALGVNMVFITNQATQFNDFAFGSDAAHTSTYFKVGTYGGTNASGNNYIAYLFATLPGVSKVGSYTGTGTTNQINCGFSSGARFVVIKRVDGIGDWYMWDSARGIVAGNDPYVRLNSDAAQVTNTDYIDPYSAGFEISSTAPAAINANGGSYIFLAIA